MKKTLLFLLLFGLLSPGTSFAQAIDTVYVRSNGNNIEVIARVWLQSRPAWNVNLMSQISNDTIYLTSCYYESILATPQLVTDTFQLGSLSSNIYTLHFKALKTYDQTHQNHSQCFHYWPNIAIINFVVAEPSGINPNSENLEPTIYPNPVTDLLYFSGNNITLLNLYDLRGKLIKRYDFAAQNYAPISVADLPQGIYFIDLISRDGAIFRKRLVKN